MVRAALRIMADWSLSRRFAVAGGTVMLAAMIGIGLFVTRSIESSVMQNTANATALFMDAFIAPLTQELAEADMLSIGPIRAIDETMSSPRMAERIVAVKIWKPGGLIAYATDIALIGKHQPVSDHLVTAFGGEVVASLTTSLDDSGAPPTGAERLLEVYSPLRANWSGRVIAVVEFYEKADQLDAALVRARQQSWIAVLAVTALIGLGLFGIVDAGSRTIDRQRRALVERVDELQRMSAENRDLRLRVEGASRRIAAVSEAHLRQLSADLHDGPAQLVGLAALRLDSLRRLGDRRRRAEEISALEGVLGEAVREIRAIGEGLSLPGITHLSLAGVAEHAIAAHERRTGTRIARSVTIDAGAAPDAVKACLYRFIQEGLNNAWRHAPGAASTVIIGDGDNRLVAGIVNGPATVEPREGRDGGMGLPGLRDRVESLGGSFSFTRTPDGGASLSMSIDITAGAPDE